MSWIGTKLLGLRLILSGGLPLPERPAINFIGATVVDNALENRIDITIDPLAQVSSATPLATPDTIVKRSSFGHANFGGVCHFADVMATGVGTFNSIACATFTSPKCTFNTIECNSVSAPFGATLALASVDTLPLSDSGFVTVTTGNAPAAISGEIAIATGSGDTTGAVIIETGAAAGAAPNGAGPIMLTAGAATGAGAAGGSIQITAGDSTTGEPGDVSITAGNGPSGAGEIDLTAKLVAITGALSVAGGTATSTITSKYINLVGELDVAGGTATSTITSKLINLVGTLDVEGGTATSDVAAQGITLTPQAPYPSAAANKKPGDVVVSIPAAAGGSTAAVDQGGLVVKAAGSQVAKMYHRPGVNKFYIEPSAGVNAVFATANTSGSIPSGGLAMGCGNSVDGDAGSVFIAAGVSQGLGQPGDIALQAGGSLSGPVQSGSILIYSPVGSGPVGNYIIGSNNKLSVTGQNVVFLGNCFAAPSNNLSTGGYLYSQSGALKWRGSSGTITTMGPADPHCATCGRDFALHHANDAWDEELAICIPCLLDALRAASISTSAFVITERRNTELNASQRVELATATAPTGEGG